MRYNINPLPKKGDRIFCIEMYEENSVIYGDTGTVTDLKSGYKDSIQINIKWDNGSSLPLLYEENSENQRDRWMLEDDYLNMKKNRKSIKEETTNDMEKYADIVSNFDMRFLDKYLEVLRESAIINMFGASPYLWMGKNNIYKHHAYVEDNEYFDELLDLADRAQLEMVTGVTNYLRKKGKEINLDMINRHIRKFATEVLNFWMKHY